MSGSSFASQCSRSGSDGEKDLSLEVTTSQFSILLCLIVLRDTDSPHVHKFFEQWRRGSVSLSGIFFRKSINRKGTFTLIFRKPDWTQPGKVLLLSECILECKFFMHLIVLNLDSCSPIFAPQPKNRSRAYISSGAFRPTLTTDRILMPVLWMIVAMVGVVSESRLTRLGRTLRYHMCTKSVGLHLHPRRVTKPMALWRCMRKLSTNTDRTAMLDDW